MEQLIAKVNLLRPHAIVLDPDFAERSAGDAFQELKQHPLMKAIPVLFFMESVSCPTPDVQPEVPAPAGNNGTGRYRVLVADDDPGMREALQITLECEGYDVELAADGEEALRLLAEQRPDVMLLDLMMPGLNGWQVIDILAQKPELRDTKVLMLTGAALSAEEAQKLNASTRGLLRKDEFKLNNILAGIARAIGRQ
jgi:CheY-like chemotaxis protein